MPEGTGVSFAVPIASGLTGQFHEMGIEGEILMRRPGLPGVLTRSSFRLRTVRGRTSVCRSGLRRRSKQEVIGV